RRPVQAQRRRANQATMRPGALTPAHSQKDMAKKKTVRPLQPIAARAKKQSWGLIAKTPTKTTGICL
ncbi:hypothetical protein ACVGXT_05685, partial [Enterobacter intestinihominis]